MYHTKVSKFPPSLHASLPTVRPPDPWSIHTLPSGFRPHLSIRSFLACMELHATSWDVMEHQTSFQGCNEHSKNRRNPATCWQIEAFFHRHLAVHLPLAKLIGALNRLVKWFKWIHTSTSPCPPCTVHYCIFFFSRCCQLPKVPLWRLAVRVWYCETAGWSLEYLGWHNMASAGRCLLPLSFSKHKAIA